LQAETDGVLWGVDRTTFRNIIVVSMMQKRQHYERVLANMQMFSTLTPENRAVIADSLILEVGGGCKFVAIFA
jgi:cAMP-dependent protein kinase regulator